MEKGKIFWLCTLTGGQDVCERKSRGKPWLRNRAWTKGNIEHSECSEGVLLHNLSLVIPNDPLDTEEAALRG